MDRLNIIFNFVFLSYASAGAGLTTAGPGREREWQQREWDEIENNVPCSPVKNSKS